MIMMAIIPLDGIHPEEAMFHGDELCGFQAI
jgi:hypothetical protein